MKMMRQKTIQKEDSKMPEWKILQSNKEDVQKTLNQWKHLYHIQIYGISSFGQTNTGVTIILTRERKGNE